MSIETYKNIKPKISKSAYIHKNATIIGDVKIGDDTSIWPGCVIRGDVNSISIGNYTNIQDGAILHVTLKDHFSPKAAPLIIGNHVTIGHNVVVHSCTIHDYSLIGIGSIVLDSAIIEKNVLLAAGSVVPPGKILEGGFLWLGNPAKKIRPLNEKEIEFFTHSSSVYVKLKNEMQEEKINC